MFETPGDIRSRAVWPLNWIEAEWVFPEPKLVITRERSRFVAWESRGLYYSVKSFCYHTSWWHFSRPDRNTALRRALDWVHGFYGPQKDDRDLVKEIVSEYEERHQQLKAIDALLETPYD